MCAYPWWDGSIPASPGILYFAYKGGVHGRDVVSDRIPLRFNNNVISMLPPGTPTFQK